MTEFTREELQHLYGLISAETARLHRNPNLRNNLRGATGARLRRQITKNEEIERKLVEMQRLLGPLPGLDKVESGSKQHLDCLSTFCGL